MDVPVPSWIVSGFVTANSAETCPAASLLVRLRWPVFFRFASVAENPSVSHGGVTVVAPSCLVRLRWPSSWRW